MLNKAIIMGRITRDPDLRYTGTGKPVCNFNVAVNDGYGDGKKTEFVNCVAWNKTAEFVNQYFAKGSMIIVDGRIATRIWDGNDGKKNYVTEVIAHSVEFGESKSGKKTDALPDDDLGDYLDEDSDLPF